MFFFVMDANMPMWICQSPNRINTHEQLCLSMLLTSEDCLGGDICVLVLDRMDRCILATDALIHAGSSRSFA